MRPYDWQREQRAARLRHALRVVGALVGLVLLGWQVTTPQPCITCWGVGLALVLPWLVHGKDWLLP